MASPTWHFDGDKRRIYEVPPLSSFVDGGGFRIYTPDDLQTAPAVLDADVQADLWSRYVDFAAAEQWTTKAFSRSGGALRGQDSQGNDVFQSVDFTLLAADGWLIVLADYSHETIFKGNLFSDQAGALFDTARLTADGVVPRLSGAADLLTYKLAGSGMTQADIDAIASAVTAAVFGHEF